MATAQSTTSVIRLLCLIVIVPVSSASERTIPVVDDATRQFDSLMEKAAVAARGAQPINLDPFQIEVASTGFLVHRFVAEFSGVALSGFEQMERIDNCQTSPENATLTCSLRLNKISVTSKAKVKGDIFLPMEHPIRTISWFKDGLIIVQMRLRTPEALPVVEHIKYADRTRMQTTITGTLNLNKERDSRFREALNNKLQIEVRDRFQKYLSAPTSKDPR